MTKAQQSNPRRGTKSAKIDATAPSSSQIDASVPDQDASVQSPAQFELSMEELETLVDRLENGDLTLEQSLDAFERGIALTRSCQRALDEAEQRVRILTTEREGAEPEEFAQSTEPSRFAASSSANARGVDDEDDKELPF